MRGRKPKPTNLKVLEGNPGQRPLNKNEPKPRRQRPTCPRWLSLEAKREWKRIVPELDRLGLLTVLDKAMLVCYCEAYAEYKDAKEKVATMGKVYPIRDELGNIKYLQQNPYVSIANKAFQQIKAACAEFGLSPSARGRIQIPGQQDEDEMESLLNEAASKKR